MKTELHGKVVVITGASGGIGSAIARSFAAEGARLVLQYRTSRRNAERLRKELTGTEVLLVRADLCRESDARRLLAAAVRRFGCVDTLIANAGSVFRSPGPHITGQTLVVAGGMEGRWLWRPEEVDPTAA